MREEAHAAVGKEAHAAAVAEVLEYFKILVEPVNLVLATNFYLNTSL